MKIVFLGNMNNLPYYFAKELKKRGYDITFIVDAKKEFLLDRPESWDKELNNNYPHWIIERPLDNALKLFKFSFPRLYFRKMIAYLDTFDIIFLNGHWISLGGFVKPTKLVIDIFAGFDLDVAADYSKTVFLDNYFKQTDNIYKKNVPSIITKAIFKRMIRFQQQGIRQAAVVNYFPTGINPDADKLLNDIKTGQTFKRLELRGFDCEKFPYKEPVFENRKFTILNITRFFYLNDSNSNKRNDIMIKGIGNFLKSNSVSPADVSILFFEKGDDLADAKRLCDDYGLTPFISWEQQIPVEELNNYFEQCDVAFDQLGQQWVGAGLFSMLTGRPLIANGRPEVFEKITKEQSPICQAVNETEVEMWLTKLYTDRNLVKQIGVASRDYVLRHYNIHNTIDFFVDCFKT